MNKEVEILIIGAGPAGLSAAIEAAKYGAKVINLADSYLNRFTSFLDPEDIKQVFAALILEQSFWKKWKN